MTVSQTGVIIDPNETTVNPLGFIIHMNSGQE